MGSRLVIHGAAGRMGRRIAAIAAKNDFFTIVAGLDHIDHPDMGKDVGTLAGIEPVNVALSSQLPESADVMIDFSLPGAFDRIIDYCVRNNVALVIGTTGLSNEQVEKINTAAGKIPIVYASNFSVGMNVLFNLVGKTARLLGDEYDIELVEAHHRFKKDSPSGTALTLAENIAKQTNRAFPDCLVHGRHGKDALRSKGSIGMHAVRGGDIVGEHSVIYSTLGETVSICPRAHSRDTFAAGAVRAAQWLIEKSPGLYSMADVLGIE